MQRACHQCGRALLPRRGLALLNPDGSHTVLCELCARPGSATATLEPMDVVKRLARHLEEAARAAAQLARGTHPRLANEAEEEAIRCIRAVRDAGDALSQGDELTDGLPGVARAARAAADALDATADAVRKTRAAAGTPSDAP